ncbi:MAG: hypothetical protein M1582_00750, partial [Actinobacteria bacterium]|nr:hypothetical protein [Actinomycetota bacterium]
VSKANGFAPAPSLDGMGSFARFQGDDYRAIAWLSANAPAGATVVEAAGGSYSQAGRVSMATGLPDLLGWDFHERQWRGAAVDAETNARKRALESIYRAGPDARSLLKQYGASYIYVGSLEREAYIKQDAGALDRLSTLGDIVYRQGPVTIYRVRE